MRDTVVTLIRKFAPLASRTGYWDAMYLSPGKPLNWREVVGERRVLILADPGSGKTFEASTRARAIRDRGEKAFFIRIEDIKNTFENAFEVGTGEEFLAWLTSNEEAWFFLDAVDEAQLETPRALENAIRIFGERIHAARERAHIFITSRDDAWQALPDRTLVERYLPYSAPTKTKNDDNNNNANNPLLKVFRLTGLTENEIELFAAHYGVGDVSAFVGAIRRSNLMSLAERPFDLKALIYVWQADRALVPTIAGTRVMIRRGYESDSPGDRDRPERGGA